MTTKTIRFILILAGFFVSIEFALTIIFAIPCIYFREIFRSMGWAIVLEKEAARWIAAIPLGTLAYVAKMGQDIAAPKGDPLPDHISAWPESDSILDFVIIGTVWASINLAITVTVLLFPKLIHSGSLFIIVLWSVVLSGYQCINVFRNEIKFKKFIKPSKNMP